MTFTSFYSSPSIVVDSLRKVNNWMLALLMTYCILTAWGPKVHSLAAGEGRKEGRREGRKGIYLGRGNNVVWGKSLDKLGRKSEVVNVGKKQERVENAQGLSSTTLALGLCSMKEGEGQSREG